MDKPMQDENLSEGQTDVESVSVPAPNVEENASPSEPQTPDAEKPTEEAAADPGTSEAAKETTDEDDAPSNDDKPKRNRAQERISRLTAEKYQAQAEAKAHAQELQRLRERLAQEPQLAEDDFEGHQAHQVRKLMTEDRLQDTAQAVASAQIRELAARQDSFIAKVEAAEHLPADALDKFAAVPVTPDSAEFIAESDKAAELANWLGSNPHEARRIASLPPLAQISALARQEAAITRAPKARKVSQAPPPASKITGTAGTTEKPVVEMSMAEYAAYRTKHG